MTEQAVQPTPQRRLPEWLKVPMPGGPNYLQVRNLMRTSELHTVCEEAHCPNIGQCWERGTATFMVLGDICTRACRYCAVTSGKPLTLDMNEPDRLARSVEHLGLKYTVITSVNRDDLPDGGAVIFAMCIKEIRKRMPHTKIEVLIPDFQGNWRALKTVMTAGPDVLNHNIETVRRIFKSVRAKGDYDQSLELLRRAKELNPGNPTKAGMIVGFGETKEEIIETMRDLLNVGVDILTIGQYLRPSQKHIQMTRFYTPKEFAELKEIGESMGFAYVSSSPLVRSSYYADEQYARAKARLDARHNAPNP